LVFLVVALAALVLLVGLLAVVLALLVLVLLLVLLVLVLLLLQGQLLAIGELPLGVALGEEPVVARREGERGEQPEDGDLAVALAAGTAPAVDVDLVGELGLDLLGRGARQGGDDRDDGEVDVGKAIDVQLAVADQA